MLYVNLGLASLTLVAWLVVRVVHGLRPRWLTSVLPGMRWKFFFACLGLAVIALVASLVVGVCSCPSDPNEHLRDCRTSRRGQLLATADRHPAHHAAAGDRGGVRLPRLPDAGVRLAVPAPAWPRC